MSAKASMRKPEAVAALVFLATSFLLIALGEWAPSVGFVGLLRSASASAGFVLMGVAFAFILVAYVRSALGERGVFSREAVLKLVRETLRFALSAVVYVGSAFIALGALAGASDSVKPYAGLKALIIVAVCVGIIIGYRAFSKRHPAKYESLSSVAIALLLALMVLLGVVVGSVLSRSAVVDLFSGPRTDLCWLASVEEDRATGRYSAFRQDELDLTFETADGHRFVITVAEGDRDELAGVAAAEGVVWLTYYPETGIFVSAEPGLEDYLATGGE